MTGPTEMPHDAPTKGSVILVVDDDPKNLAIMADCLGDCDYTVLVAEDSESAVQRALYARPDLILLDVLMPGRDGYHTCLALKELEETRDIPVIFMTALTEMEHKLRGFESGAVDYITKPFQREEVLARVGVHLRLRELTQRLEEANEELERRVAQRTLELARANDELQAEIAERRQAEMALAESKKFLDNILDRVADPVFVKDRCHRWILLNQASCALIGHPRHELLGRIDADFFPPHEARVFWEKDELVLRTGEENVNEESITDSSGQVHAVATKKALYVDESGEPFVVGVIRDLTEYKSLEAQLRHAQKMEAVGTLAGGVAHDFNNMLTAITGYASLLRHRLGEASPLRHFTDEVLAAAERAQSLTHSLLAFSRKRTCERVPMDLNLIIRRLRGFLRSVIGETITISTRLAPHELLVKVDIGQMEQLLVNMATNARDAMPHGGTLTIATEQRVRASDGSPCAALIVSDTGVGMDEQTRSRIFEPFFTTKEEGRGTGLGLAIVYAMVGQHEGQIEVQSEPGLGTRFEILLSLVEATETGTPVQQAAPPAGGTETILVAEDDKDVRSFTRTLLEEFGYHVILAEDGEDAWEQYLEHEDEIHLLLLDLVMPRQNGNETLARIASHRRGRTMPAAIFTSGYRPSPGSPPGQDLGDIEFIQKPATIQGLLGTIRKTLDKPRG